MHKCRYTLKDFDYDLPQELVAQEPAAARDASRLMVVEKVSGIISHRSFSDLPGYLKAGDCLVLNNTKVIPARLIGKKPTGAKVEIFLLRNLRAGVWEVLAKPGKRALKGGDIEFDGSAVKARITEVFGDGRRLAEFEGDVNGLLDRAGKTPLPPYIKRGDTARSSSDKERYQTVYASVPGAVAAPTAGLHFTESLLETIKKKGVSVAALTLHVGYGTFKPVEAEDVISHKMHSEWFEISTECADTINKTKRSGGSVFVVGTTAVRALESSCDEIGQIIARSGDTDIFIYPPYRFKVADALVTNFHLPKSSLLMMVSAFAGRDLVFTAYREAIEKKYRFFSYGDAMVII